ncbi:protein NYNRIN-like [Ptychodera flava]|uniref:protein NYNRIN-like n=1 Tax=Ptychodera flava TaxID=63121 RepID=UPI003969F9C0
MNTCEESGGITVEPNQTRDPLSHDSMKDDQPEQSQISEATVKSVEHLSFDPVWTKEEVRKSQLSDPEIAVILSAKENSDVRPDWNDISPHSPATKSYWSMFDQLAINQGLLYRMWESPDGGSNRWQLILPRAYRGAVINSLHSSRTGGHLGIDKTISKIRFRYHWWGLTMDVRAWLPMCNTCAGNRALGQKVKGPLQTYVVGGPMERVALDVVGPFPESQNGNHKILVIGDYFTKWIEAFAIPNEEATTVARVLVNEFSVDLAYHMRSIVIEGEIYLCCVC